MKRGFNYSYENCPHFNLGRIERGIEKLKKTNTITEAEYKAYLDAAHIVAEALPNPF